ncbi:MAG: hypothetical protein GC182_14750 [Rhodopseudomonas sp.]|nr:hypothetical protein [Rhodopseudomonas sp.]
MTDPRFSDRHPPDPGMGEPGTPHPILNRSDLDRDPATAVWSWVAGAAGVILVVVIIVAAWSGRYTDTASITPDSNPAPITTGSAPIRNVTPPPSTTGSGASSPSQFDAPATDNGPPAR